MQYNRLGTSDLLVSEIGLGCMSLPANDKEAGAVLAEALQRGINYFDTADIYDDGLNETLVGKAFNRNRDQVIIATKVGNIRRADGSGLDWNPTKKHILSSVEESLRRLQTDYIDLYQLHGGTIEDPMDETIGAFELLKEQGKIRFYGISSIRPNVIREYVRRSSISTVMMQYGLLDRRPEEECFELLRRHGISVLARGSLAQGLLAGKPAKPYLDHSAKEVENAASAVSRLSGSERTAAQTAIRYALFPPVVGAAVVGVRTMAQLDEVAGTPLSTPLSANDVHQLNELVKPVYYTAHR